MSEIKASLVKELREKTSAGMMDCKKALIEVGGDLEQAIDWLRKKGLAAAQKKSGRVTAEGLIGAAVHGKRGVLIEVNAETDFVARNEQFQQMVLEVAKIAATESYTEESLKAAPFPGTSHTVEEEVSRLIGLIGENMNLRRLVQLEVKEGIVCSYIHSAAAPNLGKIGVLVALESAAAANHHDKLTDLAKKLAMHVAASSPIALRAEDIPTSTVERERAILLEKAKESGRPDDVIEKMVEGGIRKYYEDVVFLEQSYVMDGKTRVKDILENAGKELGHPVILSGFSRFALGEGIEKAQTDFAAEVQAQLQQ